MMSNLSKSANPFDLYERKKNYRGVGIETTTYMDEHGAYFSRELIFTESSSFHMACHLQNAKKAGARVGTGANCMLHVLRGPDRLPTDTPSFRSIGSSIGAKPVKIGPAV